MHLHIYRCLLVLINNQYYYFVLLTNYYILVLNLNSHFLLVTFQGITAHFTNKWKVSLCYSKKLFNELFLITFFMTFFFLGGIHFFFYDSYISFIFQEISFQLYTVKYIHLIQKKNQLSTVCFFTSHSKGKTIRIEDLTKSIRINCYKNGQENQQSNSNMQLASFLLHEMNWSFLIVLTRLTILTKLIPKTTTPLAQNPMRILSPTLK